MRRIGAMVTAVFTATVLVAVAGCASKHPGSASGTTLPSFIAPSSSAPTTSPTPSPSASAVPLEFTVDGAGPYQLGALVDTLRAAPGLGQVASAAGCPDDMTAQATGVWAGIQLWFHKDGTLYLAVNLSPSIPTPSGAWLGTGLAQLKAIYAGIPGQLLTRSGGSAYLVTTLSGRGILFQLSAGKVTSMIAGDAAYLSASFTSGPTFC